MRRFWGHRTLPYTLLAGDRTGRSAERGGNFLRSRVDFADAATHHPTLEERWLEFPAATERGDRAGGDGGSAGRVREVRGPRCGVLVRRSSSVSHAPRTAHR